MQTISREQFKRLVESLLGEAPAILKARDKSDDKMDGKSVLLRALLTRLRERLELPDEGLPETDFTTYEYALRKEIYELAEGRAKKPFDCQKIVNEFLSGAP